MDELIKAIESLLGDIEGMLLPPLADDQHDIHWFGPFSNCEFEEDQGGSNIEWPNLAISAEDVRKALDKLKASQPAEPEVNIEGSERDLDWNDLPPPTFGGDDD